MRTIKYKLIFLMILFFQSFLLGASETYICLTMLMKDDVEGVKHCLKSVEEIVDCACICNLGSTDEALSEVSNFFQELHVPMAIFNAEGTDLVYHRTLCVKAAQKALEHWGFPLENTYLMVLDPQMQLKVDSDFQKNSLTEDAYLIREESFPLSFAQDSIHFLRASLDWKGVGITSGDWSCHQPFRTDRLNALKIQEIKEAPFTKNLLEIKAEWLNQALENDSNNARYLFDLSRVLAGLNQHQEAIQSFEAYLKIGNEKETLWFSKYMMGHCYEKMNAWDQALFWYLEAYQFNPDRAEPLQKIATYYRLKGCNDLAYLFSKYGTSLPFSKDPVLSPFPSLSAYQFDEEISISAFYTPFKKEGCNAVNQLILRKNVPWYVKDQAYRNLLFYIHPLPDARSQRIEIDLPLIQEGLDERYHPMNPSIQRTKNGYKVICRSVNYTQTGAKFFDTIDESGIFRTRNFLVDYDRHFNLIQQTEIVENLPRERIRSFNIEGLDDSRIFEFQNRMWFTCTTNDTNPTGNFQISLCRLSEDIREKIVQVDRLIPLQGPDPYRCEKNWLPFIKDGAIHVIYSYDPFVIYKVDHTTGSCELARHYSPPLDFSRFRGSAAPIPLDQGYLVLVHEVVYHPDFRRSYIHRFLFLDESFTITQISQPFLFQHEGIEFCCGMTIDHSNKQLIMTIGSEDREAFFCFVPLNTVRSLLYPLPNL